MAMKANLSWDDVAFCREHIVWLSNHGGRQLDKHAFGHDGSSAGRRCPEREAADIIDGGVYRGQDVFPRLRWAPA